MPPEVGQHLTLLHRLLAPKSGALAVDVGCGEGFATRSLADAGWRALGLEIDDTLVERARNAGAVVPGASFTVGQGQALPEDASGASLILYLFSFHHIPERARLEAIDQAREHLRREGRLHIVDPLPDGPMSEVVLPVEDERATRRHAHHLLESLDGRGWRLVSKNSYVLGRIVSDFQVIEDDLIRANPDARKLVATTRSEMMRRFMRLGVPVEGGMRLDQPCIAYHFSPT